MTDSVVAADSASIVPWQLQHQKKKLKRNIYIIIFNIKKNSKNKTL